MLPELPLSLGPRVLTFTPLTSTRHATIFPISSLTSSSPSASQQSTIRNLVLLRKCCHGHPVTPDVRVEPATIEDLDALTQLVVDLLELQDDFTPDPQLQERGIRHILEEPARGRIFVIRSEDRILGMANLLFTVSTAMGGFVLIMEDVIIHPNHRGLGLGAMLLEEVVSFAKEKNFKRITLLADKLSNDSQSFFQRHGFRFSTLIPMRLILDSSES